jgi:hypothetical protein
MTKSKNVLSNQLMDAINNSMSTKIGENCHNVLGISKKTRLGRHLYIIFGVLQVS